MAVHPLPKGNTKEAALCIVWFANQDARKRGVQAMKNLKGTKMFINDHLIPENAFQASKGDKKTKRNLKLLDDGL